MISETLSKEFQIVLKEELELELGLADAQQCLTDWVNYLNHLVEMDDRHKLQANSK